MKIDYQVHDCVDGLHSIRFTGTVSGPDNYSEYFEFDCEKYVNPLGYIEGPFAFSCRHLPESIELNATDNLNDMTDRWVEDYRANLILS